jgi:cytochrome c biogenesis protein CcdA
VYLPTIAFVFKTSHLKLEALAYLVLYNTMFVVPLFAVFLLALLGITSQQFSQAFKRHILTVKMLMAVLFFVLGIFLIWRV